MKGDWTGYATNLDDASIRTLAVLRFKVPEEKIELKRTGGTVLVRVRSEDEDRLDNPESTG